MWHCVEQYLQALSDYREHMRSGSPLAGRPTCGQDVEPIQPPAQRTNRLGLALIVVGAALGALSLTVLSWFHGTLDLLHGSQSTAGDLGDLLDRLVTARRALDDRNAIHLGLSDYYFSWLGWVLLVSVFVVAVVAIMPTAEGGPVRVLGALLALLGILATFWSLDVYRPAHDPRLPSGPSYADFLRHSSYGAWAAWAAFLLMGIGSALGPSKRSLTASR